MPAQLTAWHCERCRVTLAVVNEAGEFVLAQVGVHGDREHGLRVICPHCQYRNTWERVDKLQRIEYNAAKPAS
jgi:hypothetical protein